MSAGAFGASAMIAARPVSNNSESGVRESRGRTAVADKRDAQKSAGRLKRSKTFRRLVFLIVLLRVISRIVLLLLLLATFSLRPVRCLFGLSMCGRRAVGLLR